MKSRKRCPSCKFDRTYEGRICPVCVSAGIKDKKVNELDSYVKDCVQMVPDIHSDTVALFKETGEKMTDKKLLDALVDLSIEQVDFRGNCKFPIKLDWKVVEKAVRKAIKERYF